MKYYITTLERSVLESLNQSSKNIDNLFIDLDFDKVIIVNLLQSLITKNLVLIKNNEYSINDKISKQMLHELQRTDTQLLEIKEITGHVFSSAKENQNSSFHLKKVSLSNEDLILFKSLLFNIESFLKEASKKTKDCKTADKHIIFWGMEKYSSILNNIIEDIGA